ncbi:MAG: hypothetical protein RMK29_14410 [Myxococcales bacterium]|nr:hypothetical protein [Myxococcota bacterium]MDW8282904.1 hypothetical protein [Myxococcales bacterium]
MSLVSSADAGQTEGGQGPACFSGEPQTELELLNRCTDAERIERAHRIPAHLWDGQGPLPLPPL